MSVESPPVRRCPSVFDAGLPVLAYEHVKDPEEAHRLLALARSRSPIVLGTHGPEVLSYELVRTVLRDPRFCVPKGMFLESQGITSGPLWDRVASNLISLDGEEHHRLRRLIARAFTPRGTARLRATVVDVTADLPVSWTADSAQRSGFAAGLVRRCGLTDAPRLIPRAQVFLAMKRRSSGQMTSRL